MTWRNDPHTLSQSFAPQPKQWPSFWEEYKSDYFPSGVPLPVFFEVDGAPAVFLRFRPATDPRPQPQKCCDVSINVAPGSRGKGLGPKALLSIEGHVLQGGYDAILAEVFRDNAASMACFHKAGYEPLAVYERNNREVQSFLKVLTAKKGYNGATK
jgi:RimJ/RimL family protein N-acetyltransferase